MEGRRNGKEEGGEEGKGKKRDQGMRW